MPQVQELTPSGLRDRWPEPKQSEVVLLDVREASELEIARIDEAIHIPMNEVPARLAELDESRPVVVICHSGARSRRVAEFLAAKGFETVFNLTGGIDAWSREIDPGIPRY
jgi:rhodanese-related sulfurtransferase